MDRLAQLGGVFGSEPFILVFFQAAKLVPSNALSIFSWVAGRELVAEDVGVPEAYFNAPHL